MVNRINNSVAGEIDKLTENDSLAVLSYISELLSSRKPQHKDTLINDDFIMSLSDAYENIRDRQVIEWERLGRQKLRQTV